MKTEYFLEILNELSILLLVSKSNILPFLFLHCSTSTISRMNIPLYSSLEPCAIDTNNTVSMETHFTPLNFLPAAPTQYLFY